LALQSIAKQRADRNEFKSECFLSGKCRIEAIDLKAKVKKRQPSICSQWRLTVEGYFGE
jgi:hypothetical protein